MPLPEWQNISRYSSQVISHLPELTDLAVAEVDAGGVILSINALGQRSWDWQEGARLPNAILIALSEMKEGESLLLPVKPGGLVLLGIRMAGRRGWLLVGYLSREEVLAERASSFRSLIEKIPVLVTRMRADGTVLYANAEAQNMTGYGTEEVVGRPFWLAVVHPEDRWKLMGALRRAAEGEKTIVGVRFLTKWQGPRLAEIHLYPDVQHEEAQIEGVVFDVTERSEVEEALFQSEALYRTFLEQSPIGMLHLDTAGTVTFENYQFRQIVGESVEAAWIGRALTGIPGLDPHLHPLVARMLETGASFHSEEVLFDSRETGTRLHLVVHGSPIRHPEGDIVGGVLMVEDVTQQRRRDEELLLRDRYGEAEAALRKAALADPNVDAFLHEAARVLGETMRADRLTLLVNSPVTGYCAGRTVWQPSGLDGLRPVVIRQQAYPSLQQLETERTSLYLPDASADADGLLKATGAQEAVWMPFYEEGQLGGFVLCERTEQGERRWQEMERHLMDQIVRLFETLWTGALMESRYRHIVGSIQDCLFNFTFAEDGTRRYLFVTEQVEVLLGYTPEEVVARGARGLRWRDQVVLPEDRDEVRAHDQALRSGRESRVTYRVQHRGGEIRWLQEQGTPEVDVTGHITVSGIMTDVTEQKAAEAVLLEAKQQAESANRLKSSFIATMSHEIRTPMGATNGFAELLSHELEEYEARTGQALPPQVDEFLQAIRENTQKLLSLVNDLFDLSNLEVGSIRLDRTPVSLHEVVGRAAGKVQGMLAQKPVTLEMDLAADDLAVQADPQRLEQVLDNLLSNAAKFTQEGAVTVRTRMRGDDVVVEIEDTGVGIAPEYQAQLFSPFMQEDNRLNRRFEGTGLGLALVKRLLDLMGGRIEVDSTKGEGSCFRVLLPAAGGAAARRPQLRTGERS